MSSVFYLGILFGSLVTGKFADYYGRRPVIFGGSLFQFSICITFAFVSGYKMMVFIRFLYGFAFGLTIGLTTSMFSEIVPSKWRGKGLLLINFCLSFGKIYSIILAYTFLDDFTSGHWRAMMVCSSIPSLIVVSGSYFKMK
jgi:MFS family permease